MARAEDLTLFERSEAVLRYPKEFFERLDDKDIGEPMLYYLTLSFLVLFLTSAITKGLTLSSFDLLFAFVYAAAGAPASMWAIQITASVVNLFSHLLGGRGNFTTTAKVFYYGFTPSVLGGLLTVLPFGWVLGLVASLYTLYLLVIGLSKSENISKTKAVIALVMPFVLVAAVALALFSMGAGLVGNMMASSGLGGLTGLNA